MTPLLLLLSVALAQDTGGDTGSAEAPAPAEVAARPEPRVDRLWAER